MSKTVPTRRRDPAEVAAAVTAWLRRLPEYAGAVVGNIERPAGAGLSNETFLFDCATARGTEPLVLQVGPDGAGLFRDYDLEVMAQVQTRLRAVSEVPVAEVLAYEADPAVLGAPFYIMRKACGRVPSDNPSYHATGWFAEAGSGIQVAAWESGIAALARLHRIDVATEGFAFLADAPWGMPLDADPARVRLAQWRDFLAWGSRRPLPIVEHALDELERTRPAPPPRLAIAWGDAKISNCVIDAGVVTALLDWELCGISDAEEDLAFWLVLDWAQCRMLGLERLSALPSAAATVACYEGHAERATRDVAWWFRFGLTRLAIIYHRFLERRVELGRLGEDADFEALNPVSALLPDALDKEGLP